MTYEGSFIENYPEITEAPRYTCSLGGVLGCAMGLFNTVPILHAGAGCGLGQQFGLTYASGNNSGGPTGTTATPCSCLVEEHVIFGGENKLRNLIDSTIKLMKGDLYTVISGCVPSLIGDDVDAVIKEFTGRAPVIHVKAPGFVGNSYQGYDLFFEALIDQHLDEKPVQKGLVNIFGVVPFQHLFWKGNLRVIKELLAKLGLTANIFFTEFDSYAQLQQIPAAEHNLVLSPWNGISVAEKLQERFGTPFSVFPGVPVGPKETTRLLRLLGEALEFDAREVEAVISREERSAYRFTEYLGDALILGLPHAAFAVVADSGTAIGLTKYLTNEIAYIPALVIITDNPPPESREAITREFDAGLETVLKPEVFFIEDSHLIRQQLKKHSFLFLLASSQEKHIAGEECGAMHLSVAFPSIDRLVIDTSYAGYRGGLSLMEELTSKWAGPL